MRFAYTGRSASGPVSGEMEGADASSIAALLKSNGITPLRIAPQAGPKPARAPKAAGNEPPKEAAAAAEAAKPLNFTLGQRRAKVTPNDLMMFARQLNTLLKAGVPILRALAGLQESAVNPTMKQVLGEVRASLESGIELSKCLAQHPKVFDAFFVSMVRVGEMTGRIDEIFFRLYEHIEFETMMRQQVKSALRYPMFVIGAMVIAVGIINIFVVPAFETVFKSFGAELPLATRILIGMSNFTLQWGWFLLLLLVAAFFGLRWWMGTPVGRLAFDAFILRAPLAGRIVHKATLSRFARSFALALKSGVPLEQAMSLVASTADNALLGQKIEGMREQVERGDTILRSAMATGVFTPIVLQMIAVGEETGTIDELMEEIATLYTNDVQYELKNLSSQIEPILITFMGGMVLLLALGVFLPMWDLGKVSMKH